MKFTIQEVKELLGIDPSYERDYDITEHLDSVTHHLNNMSDVDSCIFKGDYFRVKDMYEVIGSVTIVGAGIQWEIYALKEGE